MLTGSGFGTSRPALFLAEGLTCYLTEDQNATLLDRLAALAAPGSILGIDIISHDYLDDLALRSLTCSPAAASAGSSAPTTWAGFLAAHG
jgi:O-methyltransferase involved in polyketide biosynthesis